MNSWLTVTDQQKSAPAHGVISFEEREKEIAEEVAKRTEEQERERLSPYDRWVQFNLKHAKKIMWLQMHQPKAAAILTFLVDQMDGYNAVMCSYQVFTEFFKISRQTASSAVKILKEKGLIAILKSGSSNVYAINDSLYWKSWGSNIRYSKFPANIILSEAEQDGFFEEKVGFEKIKEVKLKNPRTARPEKEPETDAP